MIFRIRLPRLDDLLETLGTDDEDRGDMGRPIWIPVKMPPGHECSCTCSAISMESTWSINFNPFIF